MSLDDINKAARALNNAADAYIGNIAEIRAQTADALEQFQNWRQDRDILGRNVGDITGSRRVGVFQGGVHSTGGMMANAPLYGDFVGANMDCGSSTNIYLHFKTNFKLEQNYQMFCYHMQGYSYGSAKIINERFVGYLYKDGHALVQTENIGLCSPISYVGSDQYLYLRIYLPSTYITMINIDAFSMGERGALDQLKSITPAATVSNVENL